LNFNPVSLRNTNSEEDAMMKDRMDYDDRNGTTVLRRTAQQNPPWSMLTWLIGRPLSTADAEHESIGKLIGLAVFASDALSSTAYATQEMLVILVLGGTAAFHFSVPISLGIVALLLILTISYEQTIHAYPGGGGAYIVARDNLGEIPALVAAAALLTDYVLTVAVSISSGVAQVVSAFPDLFRFRIEIAVILVLVAMVINLRGVREAGLAFSIPTFFFVIAMFSTVLFGLFRFFFGSLGTVVSPPEATLIEAAQPITLFLVLRAFSNGTSAVTGVEAISNGITAFKEPRSRNAGITLIWMSIILGSLLVGITFLAYKIGAVPSEEETVISQIARTVIGSRDVIYLLVIAATTVILVMAANTAFAGFPRLGAMVATDGFLPRQFAYRGSRLVYSRGIIALAVITSGLIILFRASVTSLIPLYAIGVFMSFTLSQAGMALRWWKSGHLKADQEIKERGSTIRFEKDWMVKMIINGFGSVTTFIVMMVFASTKFREGAWMIIILIPVLVFIFLGIKRHYVALAGRLSLDKYGESTRIARHRVIIPISGVHRGTMAALRYARTLTDDITAVHVSIDQDESTRIQQKWETWGDGIRLVILDSPYRLFIEPLIEYIDEIDRKRLPNETITIVVPQFLSRNRLSGMLHEHTADTLRKVLLYREIVVTEVPYQV
jgi:amino acid transporter